MHAVDIFGAQQKREPLDSADHESTDLFDPDERAFYCVRVLEIPTLRHSTYDAVAMDRDPAEATPRPSVIQERALSTPIWYTP